jgi:signal transduction histidine kinase
MWGGRSRQSTYRGPERRGDTRTPPPFGLEDPRARFWRRTALVTAALGVVALGAFALAMGGGADAEPWYAGLVLCRAFVGLTAALCLYLRWRLAGEAPLGLLSAALVVMSLPPMALSVTDVTTSPGELGLATDPLLELAVMVPAAGLLVRCLSAPAVDSGIRPGRLTVGYTAVAAVLVVAVMGIRDRTPLPWDTALGVGADLGLVALAVALAWWFRRRARAIARPITTRLAVVWAGLGLASVLDLAARQWWEPLAGLAGYVGLAAMVVANILAISLLRSVLDHRDLSMLSLSLRAESAEDSVRFEQERLHELRATLAGIRNASSTLSRDDELLDPSRKRLLEQMMTAELTRLERLLSHEERTFAAAPVALDEVIDPLVVSHREQGMTVLWRRSGVLALARADEVAEILNILMCNCRRHAPNSPVHLLVETSAETVRILVRDEGPGVPADIVGHVFDRGVRTASSPGHGLGLHIARRLAEAQGGSLTRLDAPAREGSTFALTLPGVPVSVVAPAPPRLEDAR